MDNFAFAFFSSYNFKMISNNFLLLVYVHNNTFSEVKQKKEGFRSTFVRYKLFFILEIKHIQTHIYSFIHTRSHTYVHTIVLREVIGHVCQMSTFYNETTK